MKRAPLALVFALAAVSGTACNDALPTETPVQSTLLFELSEGAALAFANALNDVRTRILPGLGEVDAVSLTPVLDELGAAIDTRDQRALQRALARTGVALSRLERPDDAAGISIELDAVRLIVEQARPLADGPAIPRAR